MSDLSSQIVEVFERIPVMRYDGVPQWERVSDYPDVMARLKNDPTEADIAVAQEIDAEMSRASLKSLHLGINNDQKILAILKWVEKLVNFAKQFKPYHLRLDGQKLNIGPFKLEQIHNHCLNFYRNFGRDDQEYYRITTSPDGGRLTIVLNKHESRPYNDEQRSLEIKIEDGQPVADLEIVTQRGGRLLGPLQKRSLP